MHGRSIVVQTQRPLPIAGAREGDLILIRPDHHVPLTVAHYPAPFAWGELLARLPDLRKTWGDLSMAELRIVLECEAEFLPDLSWHQGPEFPPA